MITHIHIKNFAIVSELQIDMTTGFTVLTGETGAGKSLWVEAAALVLGERADNSVIKKDADKSEISLCFDITHIPAAQTWLTTHEFQTENKDCILRRIINRKGHSRSSINGHPVPQNLMRELSQLLVNIHGQHQHQILLKTEQQCAVLDQYANHQQLLAQCAAFTNEWLEIDKKIHQLSKNNDPQKIEFLQYQLNELQELNLQIGEWETLSNQHKKMHHAQEIVSNANAALTALTEHAYSATQQIHDANHKLIACSQHDKKFIELTEMLENANIHINEVCHALEQYCENFNSNELSLEEIEKRFTALHDAARKHQCQPEALINKLTELETALSELENIDLKMTALKKQQAILYDQYTIEAKKLSEGRKKFSKQLEKLVSKLMQELGMTHGQFVVEIIPTENHRPTHQGLEKIQFMVCTNPGNPLQLLQKVVSGGELSRISLAIQVLTAQKENIPTLIFDEVDVGIGGQTAAIVGKLLRQLGEFTQVLCITHQPQVAAMAHHHYQVKKTSTQKSTHTTVKELTRDERIQELARMVGGVDVTEEALKHAEKLLCE
ncbi:MAG: DNA repair protein RecN [Gammaproteobacteria bacterium RIFCSPHIGHO2_12_FULL_41_15]|nr:MAG: DNA repair protein RecN [Gammaproteobacteria bacterium RIFCSPHIGHO2_12_FULL_41_15]